jgi:hypothetical protein
LLLSDWWFCLSTSFDALYGLGLEGSVISCFVEMIRLERMHSYVLGRRCLMEGEYGLFCGMR